jgi:hypothetical protein
MNNVIIDSEYKKILLIEPNPFHAEVIPGIAKYLEDIGYRVNVAVCRSLLNDNVFCRCTNHINVQAYDFSDISLLLSAENIRFYDFIFFSSMEFILDGVLVNILQYLGFIPKTKYGILGIYHTTSHIDFFQDYRMANEGRYFCFSDFQIHNYPISVLNPHYFGSSNSCKNSTLGGRGAFKFRFIYKKDIVCVGNAFDTSMLPDALYQMYRQKIKPLQVTHYGGKRHTVFQRIKEFINGIIILILSPFSTHFMKKHLFKKYVIQKGRVSFKKLYSALDKCKYILVLINPHDKSHEHYITYTTSGIKQIILGFGKIPIIHEEVASKYGFDQTNSILYNDVNISSALLAALNDNADMISSINALENNIYSLSRTNLKSVVSKIISLDRTEPEWELYYDR